jgi:DNA mismatch repair protein MutS2
MEFDGASGHPTFRLRPGPPGGSEALALARRLGLPGRWLERAEARLSSEHRELRRLLAEVERLRAELAAARDEARREVAQAIRLRQQLEAERAELEDERRALGKKLKGELDAFRRETRDRLQREVDRMREELEAGRRRGLAERATERIFAEAPPLPAPAPEAAGPLAVGGTVRHRGLGWEGLLEKLEGERAEVSVKGKRLRCKATELASVAGVPGGRSWGVTVVRDEGAQVPLELHLIGERVEPALERLDEFLDQALLTTLEEVRVVHGHGTGRLRQAVREHLRRHPAVAAQRPGEAGEGGNGATVVALRRSA